MCCKLLFGEGKWRSKGSKKKPHRREDGSIHNAKVRCAVYHQLVADGSTIFSRQHGHRAARVERSPHVLSEVLLPLIVRCNVSPRVTITRNDFVQRCSSGDFPAVFRRGYKEVFVSSSQTSQYGCKIHIYVYIRTDIKGPGVEIDVGISGRVRCVDMDGSTREGMGDNGGNLNVRMIGIRILWVRV